MNKCCSIRFEVLMACALLYLLVPNILFLWGWYEPWVAVMATLCLLASVVWAFRLNDEFVPWRFSIKDFIILIVFFLLLVLKIASVGLVGYFITHGDLAVFREAFLQNLSKAPWPLVLPDGREMTYYLGGDLMGALLMRLVPFESHHHVCLCLWSALGFLLATLMCCGRVKRFSWLLIVLLFCYMDFINLFTCVVLRHGMPLLMELCPVAKGLFRNIEPYMSFQDGVLAFASLSSKFPTAIGRCEMYNSAPAMALVLSCIYHVRFRCIALVPLLIVLLLPLSPLGAVGSMPLAVYVYLHDIQKIGRCILFERGILLLLSVFLAILYAVYYLRTDGTVQMGLSNLSWGWGKMVLYFANVSAVTFCMVLPMLKKMKRNGRACIVVACLCLYPLLYVGDMQCNTVNEFWYKNGFAFSMVLCFIFYGYMPRLGKWRYLPIGIALICFPIVVAAFFNTIKRNDDATISDYWNGHVGYDCPVHRQKIPNCKPDLIPGLLLHESGASERSFPGCLLPKAPGCDYSAPPKPGVRLH